MHVGKWALVMTLCLHARWMQMAESRCIYTPAQQRMRSSNLFACTSSFSAVVAKLLISRHASCKKFLFLVQMFHFWLNYRECHLYFRKKAVIPRKSFSTREGRQCLWADMHPRADKEEKQKSDPLKKIGSQNVQTRTYKDVEITQSRTFGRSRKTVFSIGFSMGEGQGIQLQQDFSW